MTFFLDIDGVMNHGTAMSAFSDDSITPYAINSLNSLIEHYGENTEVVITSQWKDAFPANRVIQFLVDKGLKCNKINVTELDSKKDYGIRLYCEQNNVQDFCVLDDNFDTNDKEFFEGKLYKVNTHDGLTDNDVLVIKRTFSDTVHNLSKYYFTPEEIKFAFDAIRKYSVEIKTPENIDGDLDRTIETIDSRELIWFLFKTKYGVDLKV